MKYLVAVSGGVDSVVLLDMLAKRDALQLVVAHFDHGIRPDSADDARFVELLARVYDVPFVMKREELGANASEELARKRRYIFLREEAKKHDATIVTAHHKNDLIETIAINIYRGTGWRGLAVLGDSVILRPLLEMTKDNLYAYALKNRLEWVEDSTNRDQKYLRNRIRAKLSTLSPAAETRLEQLWYRQKEVKQAIDEAASELVKSGPYSRYFFTSIDTISAQELLRRVILTGVKKSLLRPQLERALLAIKTAKPGATMQAGEGISLRFTATSFIVEPPQKVL